MKSFDTSISYVKTLDVDLWLKCPDVLAQSRRVWKDVCMSFENKPFTTDLYVISSLG